MTDYSNYECLIVEVKNKLATVTFNRPDRGNAINHRFHVELETIWPDLMKDKSVNAILLSGSGKYFCVGGDIKGMQDRPAGDVLEEGAVLWPTARIVENMLDCEKPIVCAINGDCMGLGATVALFTDITVMNETARIGDPHVKIGLVAGDGGAVIWPFLVGPSRAKEFLMRGSKIVGKDAERFGLVNYACPLDEVFEKAREIAQELADGPTYAIRGTKASVNKILKDCANIVLDASHALEIATFYTEDHKEAVMSFIEKRKPNFTGR